jgi:hypothetical protein
MVWGCCPVERSISQLAPWAGGISLASGLVVLAVLTRPWRGTLAAASLWLVIPLLFGAYGPLVESPWPAAPFGRPDFYQSFGLCLLAWAVALALVVWGRRAPLIIGPSLLLVGGTILLGQFIPGSMTVSSAPPTAATTASRPLLVDLLIFGLPLVHWPILGALSSSRFAVRRSQ